MNKQVRLTWLLVAGVVALFAALPAGAGKGPCCMSCMGAYDPETELVLEGIVEEVSKVQGCMMGGTGTHVMLRSGTEVLEVALGPSDFLAKKEFEIVKGDTIRITGSKLKLEEVEFVLAREVTKGKQSLTLRDAKGVPAWSRKGRSS